MLLAGPAESLPNWLVLVRMFDVKKVVIYVLTTIVIAAFTVYIARNTIWRILVLSRTRREHSLIVSI